MVMNKEEIGKERIKTKRKEGIKRAASPTKSKTGSHLVNVPAIFLTSAHNTVSVCCLRKTNCSRKFVNKKKATQIYFLFSHECELPASPGKLRAVCFCDAAADNCASSICRTDHKGLPKPLPFSLFIPSVFLFGFLTAGKTYFLFFFVFFLTCASLWWSLSSNIF